MSEENRPSDEARESEEPQQPEEERSRQEEPTQATGERAGGAGQEGEKGFVDKAKEALEKAKNRLTGGR